ncbi:DUF456 domain-containing protein [Amycolatopsis pithecellobii]|uniref:Uncharacterized protein n=1 Tax=Amycolatopsis pithecellobii TaxID=664692 RepID=A0A6N7Z3M2_9PSEU|nr:DUF456 domain-containing protein [Amycolatopsis pithecellobii]MTD54770.1 hypothetical protein [Amycolatopsis pithecellobii]
MSTVPDTAVPQDDTTRYLCAAAHVDFRYADAAIREFVVEPTRPVPPSPGFQPANVLVEAIASRTRRKYRDGALAVLAGLFIWLAWGTWLLYGWLIVGVAAAIPSMLVAAGKSGTGTGTKLATAARTRKAGGVIAVIVGILLIGSLASGALQGAFGSSSRDRYYYDDVYPYEPPAQLWPYALIPLVLIGVVLILDRLFVWNVLRTRFGYGTRNRPPAGPTDAEEQLLAVSPRRFLGNLDRYRTPAPQTAGGAPLIVHRGYNPFVGAGLHREPWSMALPLEKLSQDTKPDGSPFDELTTISLYDRVREAMSALQASNALSPDQRLRSLKIIDAVYASASELIDHLPDSTTDLYLSHVDFPPNSTLPATEVAALRRQPREWARYYLCFQVETWDRDLVMSSFLHAAVDETTLYLEWTPCVLPPVREEYRAVDKLNSNIAVPLGQALLRWVKLPASILGRTVHTLGLIRPLRREREIINPDAYGTLRTLREMAAANEVPNYFQLVDIERYEKIMHSRLIPAISRILRDSGYSPATFERQAEMVVNNDVTIEHNFGAFNVGGKVSGDMSGATVRAGAEK